MIEQVKQFITYAESNYLPIENIVLSNKDGILLKHVFSKEPKVVRNIYSHTKSYVSTLLGILFSEGRVNLDEPIMNFFLEYREKMSNPDLENITIRHLLTMSSGFNEALLMSGERKFGVGFPDYVNFVLSHEVKTEPGSKFLYSNGDSYLIGKIIEKIVGKKLQEYAYEVLLRPLGILYPTWECDPTGSALGATGLFLSVEEMNKLGILYLNHGVLNGKKILSDEWINMIFTTQIVPDDSKWNSGYSFQFWKNPDNRGFRCDGAWGQITHLFLEEGYALSYQSPEDGDPGKVREALYDFIF